MHRIFNTLYIYIYYLNMFLFLKITKDTIIWTLHYTEFFNRKLYYEIIDNINILYLLLDKIIENINSLQQILSTIKNE